MSNSALARAVRVVFPANATKRLAGLAGVPVGRAHEWLYRHFSAQRRRELARALLDELDRQDREERADARRLLKNMVGSNGEMAVADCGLDFGAPRPALEKPAAGGARAGDPRRPVTTDQRHRAA